MAAVEEVTLDMGVGMETEEGLAIIEALDRVTDVLEMAGSQVRFAGQRVTEVGSYGHISGCDVFAGRRGSILFFRESCDQSWAVSGTSLDEALAAVEDRDVAAHVRANLQDKGVLRAGPPMATG